MKSSSRAGENTNFPTKIAKGAKKHTIRKNLEFWAPRIDDVAAGKARLSIRVWTGAPYRSKQKEVVTLDFARWQTCVKTPRGIEIDGILQDVKTIARNDGLQVEDFKEWFEDVPFGEPLILIHFTNDLWYGDPMAYF